MSKTMQPGREMDALIAEKIFGEVVDVASHSWQDGYNYEGTFYSTDIAAAIKVAENMAWSHRFALQHDPNTQFKGEEWRASFNLIDTISAHAPTAPHAICLAALKAIGAL